MTRFEISNKLDLLEYKLLKIEFMLDEIERKLYLFK